jgi:regulator of nonsense transcripts 1
MDFSYGGMTSSAFKERIKVLKNAQVVCCTCIGSGGDILDSMTFERVLVDEVSSSTMMQ